MKATLRPIVLLLAMLCIKLTYAQEFTAGINTETPNPNAVLHLVSPNGDQGLLIPSLTNAQRTAMSSSLSAADNGLMVFDNEDNIFYFWVAPNWVANTNTDNQNLTLSGTDLTIDNGNTIDLSSINTDNQNLSLTGTNLSVDRGNTIDLLSTGFLLTESDPTVPANIKDGIDWTELSGIPTNLDLDQTDDVVQTTSLPAGDIQGSFQAGLNIDVGVVSSLELQDNTIVDADISTGANISENKLSANVMVAGENVGLLNNDVGYITAESQDISTDATPGNITITGGSTLSLNVDDADNSITNEIQDISTDATPGNITLSSGSTLSLNVDDADNSITNEIQDAPAVAYDPTGDLVLSVSATNVEAAIKELDVLINAGDGDGDSSNELQDISTDATPGNITLSSGSTLSLNVDDADNSITNELQDISTDATPGNITLSSGSTLSLNVDDADNSITNEIQDAPAVAYDPTGDLVLSVSATNVEAAIKELDVLINAGDGDGDSSNELQDISTDATPGNITLSSGSTLSLNVDDADNSITNEIQDISTDATPGNITLSSGSTLSLNVDDADNSITNEIQDISTDATPGNITLSSGSTLSLNVDDADNSITNEIQDAPAVAYDPTGDLVLSVSATNVEAAIKELDALVSAGDADSDPSNEIQDAPAVVYDPTGDLILSAAATDVEAAIKELDALVSAGDADSDPSNEIQDAPAVVYDPTGDLILSAAATDVEAAIKELDALVSAGDADSDPSNEIQDAPAVVYDPTGDLILSAAATDVEAAIKELDALVSAGDADSDPSNEIQDAPAVIYDPTGDLILSAAATDVEAAIKELDALVSAGDADSDPSNEIQDAPAVVYDPTGDLILSAAATDVEAAIKELDALVSAGDADSDPSNEIQDAPAVVYDPTGDLILSAAATDVEAAIKELDAAVDAGLILPYSGSDNTSDAFSITQTGTFRAGLFQVSNTGSVVPALEALSDGAFNSYALLAQSTGAGDAARISYDNASGTAQALNLFTSGLGHGATFGINNASNNTAVLSITHAGSGAGITTDAPIGIGVANPLSPLQIGDELGFGHFENATEMINGDAILSNVYPDYSNATDNQLRRTNTDSVSFIFFDDGKISFLNAPNGAANSIVDISMAGDVRTWMEMLNDGNIKVEGGLELGTPDPGEEKEGMLRWTGSNFEGNTDGSGSGWVPLDEPLTLPYAATEANALSLLDIEQTGAGRAALFAVTNTTHNDPALEVRSNGNGATSYLARFDRTSGSTGSGVFYDMNGVNNPAILIDNTTAPIQIFDGAGLGFVLTSDANGVGRWAQNFGRVQGSFNLITEMAGTGGMLSSGADNTFIGRTVGNGVTTGSGNVLIGSEVATALTTAGGNIAIGFQSGGANMATGGDNITIGTRAVLAGGPTNSTDNIAIGRDAQATLSATAIGADARATAPGSVAIGTGARATALNTVTLGEATGTRYNLEVTGNLVSSVSNVTAPGDGFTPASRIITLDASVNITNISAGSQGQEIILVTLGDAVINEGGNIDLATPSFNPGVANSTLHLVYIGSAWVEISRSLK
ncbi:beta strand repeat-containing protein [Ekhidna sp.]